MTDDEILIITFKSTPEFYLKEFKGLKRNTIRKKDCDYRFDVLDKWDLKSITYITIVNSENPNLKFTNLIKDVSKFDDYYIISW